MIKKLSKRDFNLIIDILMEDASKVKVYYSPKKDYRE